MRIAELILFMLMLANTLNASIEKKDAQIHEENFEETNVQRKLEEKTNYVTLILNEEVTTDIKIKTTITKIIINGEEQDLTKEITFQKDTEIQVHYGIITDGSGLFSVIDYSIRRKIVSVDLSKFDSSNLETTSGMFERCSSLSSIDFSNFDTSKVTDMQSMFFNCSSLQSIDLAKFDTSKVTNMQYMFFNCSSLQSIDLAKFDTLKVTNMDYMFQNCTSLKSIDLAKFDTSNVISMTMMFLNCSSLITLNLSNFDTSKVTNMDYMFQNCTSLKFLDISNFKITDETLNNRTNNIKYFPNFDIFLNDKNIEYINLYDTIDNGFISNSSINEIDNLIVCQKYNIITNPTAQNKCSEFYKSDTEDYSTDYYSTEDYSTETFKMSQSIDLIDSTIVYSDSTLPITQEEIYIINTKVFLLGYTTFNIINANIFSFFIYFFAPKNIIYSQILYFPITITYKNRLRILQDNTEANCTKVEPNDAELNKYNCLVLAQTSNIDDIDLSTDFNFKPKTIFNNFFISSLAKMDLHNFPNINSQEYNSQEIFILDNSTINKYNNTHFLIKGTIEDSNPQFDEKAQLLIENNLSENDKYKKLDCSISKEKNNNYNLICLANENMEFNSQGLISLSGSSIILINLESENADEKFTFDNTAIEKPKQYLKKKESSKKWVIAVVIVPIVVLLILIGVIVFVVKKRNHKVEQNTTEVYLNQITN